LPILFLEILGHGFEIIGHKMKKRVHFLFVVATELVVEALL
jgi:hypothetical protein